MKILNKLLLLATILMTVFLLTSCNTKGEYEDAMTFTDDLAGVKLRGLYGFIDMEGNLKIKPSYEQVQSFYNGTALVKQNGLWGLIDKTNTVIIPFKYTEASMISEDFIAVKENDKYGCINLKGDVVVDFISKSQLEISYGSNKHAVVLITDNNKKGFIDLDTGFKSPPIYNEIFYGGNENNILTLIINGKSGTINSGYANLDTQTIIEPQYPNFLSFMDGLSPVEINGKYGYINKKSGYINTRGEIVIPLIYDFADAFYEGLARISLDNKSGLINTKGEILCEPKFSQIDWYGDSDIMPAAYIDDNGNSKYVCINKYGEILFETNYTNILPSMSNSQDILQVRKNNKVGYINKKGIEILPPIYDNSYKVGELFIVSTNNKSGLVSKYQKELLKCEYTTIDFVAENIFSISKDNKYGIYNAITNTSTELLYDEIKHSSNEAIPVRIGDKWHYIDLDGNKL